MSASAVLAVHGHPTDPGKHPDAPDVVMQMLPAQGQVAEWPPADADAVSETTNASEGDAERRPTERGSPLPGSEPMPKTR